MNTDPRPLKFSVGDRVTLLGDPRRPPLLGTVTNWREDPTNSGISQFFEVTWGAELRTWHHGSGLQLHVTPTVRDVIDGPVNDGLEAWVDQRAKQNAAVPPAVVHEYRRRMGLEYQPQVAQHWRAAQLEAIVHGYPPAEQEVH